MALTRDQILKADDLRREEVEVPEWGGTVFVRTMTGAERDSFEEEILKSGMKATMDNVRARLLVRVLVDKDGKRLFQDSEFALLGAKSTAALENLVNTAQMLNGVTQDDLENIKKNSGIVPSVDSTSD